MSSETLSNAPELVTVYLAGFARATSHGQSLPLDLQSQEKVVKEWLSPNQTVAFYTDSDRSLSQLKEALLHSMKDNKPLVIAASQHLIKTNQLLDLLKRLSQDYPDLKNVQTICLDNPMLSTVGALENHAEEALKQSKEHGERIRMGLAHSMGRSGNPRAKQVISEVNWIKTRNALMYALLLEPLYDTLVKNQLSQRQMVEYLNRSQLCAPEGGRWVLSQLQKVIDRIKVNKAALAMVEHLNTLDDNHYESVDHLTSELNRSKAVKPFKGSYWDSAQVEKTLRRIQELEEMIEFNNFLWDNQDILQSFHLDNLTEESLSQYLLDTARFSSAQLNGNLDEEVLDLNWRRYLSKHKLSTMIQWIIRAIDSARLSHRALLANPEYTRLLRAMVQSDQVSSLVQMSYDFTQALTPMTHEFISPSIEMEKKPEAPEMDVPRTPFAS